MQLIVRPEAEADLAQAYAWYEERRTDLGREFMEEAARCLKSIEQRSLSFARVDELVRRAILHRFPYALFFLVSTEEVSVIAAFHMARHPDALSLRLGPDA
jgi:plasmid stabilization system protein ParE